MKEGRFKRVDICMQYCKHWFSYWEIETVNITINKNSCFLCSRPTSFTYSGGGSVQASLNSSMLPHFISKLIGAFTLSQPLSHSGLPLPTTIVICLKHNPMVEKQPDKKLCNERGLVWGRGRHIKNVAYTWLKFIKFHYPLWKELLQI